jgi:hypothetical protein
MNIKPQSSFGRFAQRIQVAATRGFVRFCLAFVFVVCIASVSLCCSIPVFRYALEHWHPELFVIHVISSSPLDASDNSLLHQLEASSGNANVRWLVSDGKKLSSGPLKGIVDKANASNTVWLAVESTKKSGGTKPQVWDAPFTKESAKQLLSSPVRDRVCQGLVEKDSVAWVFVESGKPSLDDAKFAKLESELHRLEGVIKLPVIEEADLKNLSKRPEELKVKFSAHRLSRSDPAEAAFISMLLATESDLQEEFDNGSPMAFPIFGRGRVLYALLGDGIATSTIEEACRFLAGACQCTVKADNPGVDLLMSFDWDGHVQITEPKKADDVPLTGLGSFAKPIATPASESVVDNARTAPSEQPVSRLAKEHPTKGDALEHEDLKPEFAKGPKSNVGDSEITYALPKPASAPTSIWLTLGVLTAIVGIATVSWKFLIGTKP